MTISLCVYPSLFMCVCVCVFVATVSCVVCINTVRDDQFKNIFLKYCLNQLETNFVGTSISEQ